MNEVPPPLFIHVPVEVEPALDKRHLIDVRGPRQNLTLAFGAILLASRTERGWTAPLILHGGDTRPAPVAGGIWIPHVCCAGESRQPTLVWELSSKSGVEEKLGATFAAAERWARQPGAILEIASRAGLRNGVVEEGDTRIHLSLRWILANQDVAAEVATTARVAIDHVSLHVSPDEEDAVVRLLVDALGLAEIPRPAKIRVSGRWLQAGQSRIHLNSRSVNPGEADFPGPRPNHICFCVPDLDAAEAALKAAGVATRRAGSLGQQLWFRLAGASIELQPLGNRPFLLFVE